VDQKAILYDGKPANVTFDAGIILTTFTPSVAMNPGETSTGNITLPITGYSSGMTLEITGQFLLFWFLEQLYAALVNASL
jgi:hypothetical protein